MISIIICSLHTELDSALRINIAQTIGCKYEIIHIDNSQNKYNIFQAYNIGVKRAKGDILCFMHEDIVYHSKDWGGCVEEHFRKRNIGAIGVAGGKYIPKELDWRFIGFMEMSLLQGYNTCEPQPQYTIVTYPPQKANSKELTQVALLDGVWICIKKDTFNSIRWDDDTYHGFHLYDSDICMQINESGMNIYVCHDIILEHKSYGTFTEEYNNCLELFFEKWRDKLPLQKGCDASDTEIAKVFEEGETLFKRRLTEDKTRIGIVKKTQLEVYTYTQEEKTFISKDIIFFYKKQIKDKHIDYTQAANTLKHCLRSKFLNFNTKIIFTLKFMWYRVVFTNKMR